MTDSTLSLDALFTRFAAKRRAAIGLIDTIAPGDRDRIPDGLRNHIHWQAGHLVTVQASLLYHRCGLEPFLSPEYFACFAKGTSPAEWSDPVPSFDTVRILLEDSLAITQSDLPRIGDAVYPEAITVSTGDMLSGFREALDFMSYHEAMHIGAMNVMRRLLTQA